MRNKILGTVSAMFIAIAMANATDKVYGPINISATSISGDQVSGPAQVQLVGLNTIQRNIQVGVNVTYPAGPDLSLPFIPPIPTAGKQTTPPVQPPGGAPAPSGAGATQAQNARARRAITSQSLSTNQDVNVVFNGLVDALNNYETDRSSVQEAIQNTILLTNQTTTAVTAFVQSVDSSLAAQPTGATVLLRIPAVNAQIDMALMAVWPNADIAGLEGNLQVLKNNLATLQDQGGWAAWVAIGGNKAAYDGVGARVNDLITLAATFDPTANKSAATLTDAQTKLQQWSAILSAIAAAPNPFARTINVTCSFGFGNNKNTVIELVSTDRLAAAGSTPTKLDVVTVICSSPLSISGGLGFSTAPEQQFSFVQSVNSSGQVVSALGYKALSKFRPLPLLLLNTRLLEWKDVWGLHVSNGAVVDIKTGAAGGTDVEYVSGLSVSFKRTLFVTTAFQAARVQSLDPGFTIGQTVPSAITTPPVQARWSPAFVLAFTYKLK
jgi:hypothetical protein